MLARGRAFANRNGVDLVMAYAVPVEGGLMDNQYAWISPEGVLEHYIKHYPVPGEPSVRGTDTLIVHDRPYGRAAGAICYDYDFPGMGRQHAKLGADLVVVPSSDWKGIDPYHTQMAAVRGIEGGFSVVRPVRYATSGAFDAYGVRRASANYFEGERVFVASVPARRIETPYSRIGDVVPLAALLAVLAAVVALFRRRNQPKPG
jgi:apolipoprotein N-acyltransferase